MEGLAVLQEIQIQLNFAGLNRDLFKLAKDLSFVSIWEGTGPLTFSTIYKTLTNVEDSLQRVVFPF